MDEQFAVVTITGTVEVLAGIAYMLSQNAIVDTGATLVKAGKQWTLTVGVSPEFTVSEDEQAEWFTNVQATGAIDGFDPIEGCWDEDEKS